MAADRQRSCFRTNSLLDWMLSDVALKLDAKAKCLLFLDGILGS